MKITSKTRHIDQHVGVNVC